MIIKCIKVIRVTLHILEITGYKNIRYIFKMYNNRHININCSVNYYSYKYLINIIFYKTNSNRSKLDQEIITIPYS